MCYLHMNTFTSIPWYKCAVTGQLLGLRVPLATTTALEPSCFSLRPETENGGSLGNFQAFSGRLELPRRPALRTAQLQDSCLLYVQTATVACPSLYGARQSKTLQHISTVLILFL